MQQEPGAGSAGGCQPALTGVALVISQPMLVQMVQGVLNQCQEAQVCLITDSPADLATLASRVSPHC